ncbi:MAG TPA: substrate-binding domain-containing protein [Acidobacteriaceae bacterium]|nr:substrate-binding domain-containing protein [Acidobacteriaceae bacterium]
MSSVTKLLVLSVLAWTSASLAAATTLRVCADPNNLPFSNRAQQGFENHLAQMVAKDLGMRVSYDWFPQRSAFFRKTLNAGQCDVVMGVPSGIPVASTTIPYYRSSYVFVTRRASHLDLTSLDDPRLHQLRIGVHITGDQDSSLPPVNALLRRGIVRNLVGYSIYGTLSEKNPPSDLIQAVAQKKVDVAIAWGPMAGYFARRASVPLAVNPVDVVSPDPKMPFTFAISMGVRHGDRALLQQLNAEIQRREPQIRQMLKSYGVPLLATPPTVQVGN